MFINNSALRRIKKEYEELKKDFSKDLTINADPIETETINTKGERNKLF